MPFVPDPSFSASACARLRASRIDSTRAIVAQIAELPQEERPKVFVCASAVGFYGDRGDEALVEDAAPGEGLLADLCVDWEAAAAEALRLGVRTCSLCGPSPSSHGTPRRLRAA